MTAQILAVIDIGSNTSRVTVFQVNEDGYCEPIADSRAALKLLRGLGSNGRSESEATASLMAALRDFQVVACGVGAERTVALGTYTVRGYPQARDLVRRIESDIGIEVQILDGQREAELAFLGAIYGTDVEDGMLLDLGGGSLELALFRKRSLVRSWSLPLGALLMSDRFLRDDPPTKSQIQLLQEHVASALSDADVRQLKTRETLIGTGGTVRSLAKIDRYNRRYPIPQLHGYVLSRRRVKELSLQLAAESREALAARPVLRSDRRDSIIAGALTLHAIQRHLRAKVVQVSGQGLREGFALSTRMDQLPPARGVRRTAIHALARRFATWDARIAERRTALATALQGVLDPEASQEMQESLLHAAWIADVGKSIDYADRFLHTASVVLATDLAGFSHRQIALLAAIIGAADRRRSTWRHLRPLLTSRDEPGLERAGLLLALADEVEKRLPPENGIPVAFHDAQRAYIGVNLPAPYGGRLATLAERFPEVFGWELRFEGKG